MHKVDVLSKEVDCPTCKGGGKVSQTYLALHKPRITAAVPMKEWSYGGHVEYEMSKDGESAKLKYHYRDTKRDGPGEPNMEIMLGRCIRHRENRMWIGHNRLGYPVYFVIPIPIGYGMVTGHYHRKKAD